MRNRRYANRNLDVKLIMCPECSEVVAVPSDYEGPCPTCAKTDPYTMGADSHAVLTEDQLYRKDPASFFRKVLIDTSKTRV
jgi:hypothetical protein